MNIDILIFLQAHQIIDFPKYKTYSVTEFIGKI